MKLYFSLMFLLLIGQVFAQTTMFEQEPNNKPGTENKISPPVIVLGDMQNNDQDLFVWEVSDVDAGYLWEFVLDGLPEKNTKVDVMQLMWTEDGTGVTKVDRLMSVNNQQGIHTVSEGGLIFSPGVYYLGVSYAGGQSSAKSFLNHDKLLNDLGGDFVAENQQLNAIQVEPQSTYQLEIKKGRKIDTINSENNNQDKPSSLRLNGLKGVYFHTEKQWIKFKLSAQNASKVWKIKGNTHVGGSLKMDLYDPNETILTSVISDADGRFNMSDLKLPTGEYMLGLSSQENTMATIALIEVGEFVDGNETEPNNNFSTANRFDRALGITAQMNQSYEKDYFAIELNEESTQNQIDLKLINPDKAKLTVCLFDDHHTELQCKVSSSDVVLSQLSLLPGDYFVKVSGGVVNSKYKLEVIQGEPRGALDEAEPNDTLNRASSMNQKRISKGRFAGKDVDYFVFEVGEQPQLWTLQAIGQNLTQIALFDAAKQKVQEFRYPQGTQRARISNLSLLPGKHYIQLKGENDQYILRAFPTGPDDGSLESEPNDSAQQAELLGFNQIKKGGLNHLGDIDMYRFKLNSQQGIRLEVEPAPDARVYYKLNWENMKLAGGISEPGEKLLFQGTLPAGEYHVSVQPYKLTSTDVYQLQLKPVNLLACVLDCEPNDSAHQANLINAAAGVIGESGTHQDYDWYKLPAFGAETTVTFQHNQGTFSNELSGYTNYDDKLDIQLSEDKKNMVFVIAANQASYFRINKDTTYDYTVLVDNQVIQAPTLYKDMKVTVQDLPDKVQAYSTYGQSIQASIMIENQGTVDQQVNIKTAINDHRWTVSVNQSNESFTLKAKDKITVPLDLQVPNELTRNQLARLDIAIENETGLLAKTSHDIQIANNVPLIQPKQYWAIDSQLLGGINVAAAAMGSQRTAADKEMNDKTTGKGFDQLFDGVVGDGLGMQYRSNRGTEQDFITIDLAGDETIQVKGFLLNPVSHGQPNEYLKDFDFQLSEDGVNFNSVFKGQLQAIKNEQSFVLPEPITAKYARLNLLSSYSNQEKPATTLGEWKVIASPDQPFNVDQGFNIADPQLGGHVVWAVPESQNSWNQNLLTEKKESLKIRSKSDETWQWVVGFHHQRAAKVEKIEWVHGSVDPGIKNFKPLDQVKVMTSIDSNVGPWKLVAEKSFEHIQSMDEIVFDQPVWARYVKFSVGEVGKSKTAYLPETIRIIEQKSDGDYRSILGEWGQLSVDAIYEMSQEIPVFAEHENSHNHSRATAIDLTATASVSGQVQLEKSDQHDWYKFKTPAGSNTMKINLSGKFTVETVIHVEDAQGNSIPLPVQNKQNNLITYHVPVSADAEYYIKVEEPPRSVIFAWDTSGSTADYHSRIFDAISSYSNDVVEGRDTVNFLPFGGQLLMKGWYGRPHYLKTVLNNYRRLDDSSHAEKYLHDAARALQQRQGSKAIIIITDAITGKYTPLWDALKSSQPKVFSIGIIRNGFGGNSNRQVDLMQSWSQVNHGDFQQAVSFSQVETAFDRAAVKLRQPADYTLAVSSAFIKAPGPGQLVINQQDSQSNAVELILDASGSMLKRLDGQRRIDIAKDVLIQTVTDIIPEGTPLALRVFGDKQANACRTDLAIKASPLNRDKAKNILSQINAKNLAKTPIADSLAQVPEDLKSHTGKKVVILVTDGEETCDGDPEMVINQLVEQGIDLRLNIVGFAIDDAELKEQFNQWSTQASGKYFDSNDSETLKQSISDALKTPFSVYSLTGELIKEGVVNGEPLELPSGHYNIKVYGNEVHTIENYHIKGDIEQLIEL